MAPIPADKSKNHYNYLVIGGGSAGCASARRAAKHGAKAVVIEGDRLGGTCVNVGCVPKKIMWSASDLAGRIRQAHHYGFPEVDPKLADKFAWNEFKEKRDAYIKRLNGNYERNLDKEGVDVVFGWAQLKDSKTVQVSLNDGGKAEYTADHIAICAGGTPNIPKDVKGAELGITSDGFFELENQPKKVAIVGAGYIAVELAGVFQNLGTETHLFIRGDTVLRSFDPMIQNMVTDGYEKQGMKIHKRLKETYYCEKGEKEGSVKFHFETVEGSKVEEFDSLIWTIGRHPEVCNESSAAGVEKDTKGKIIVNDYQESNVPGIYALGDISNTHFELTPVAIASGRKLSDRLFGPEKFKNQKQDYENIPSVVFSHPESGTIGLSEPQAAEKYGKDNIKVYQAKFISMYNAPLPQEEKEYTCYKLVCAGKEEKVVGMHIFGQDSAEILQGFGVAIRMGATKADFDSCVAIHPTAAEELVTMT